MAPFFYGVGMTRITYIPNRVIDINGISDGANLYVYQAGTTTPVSIYSDEDLTTPVSNPYPVSAGAAVPPLFHGYSGLIRLRVVASDGSVPMDEDPYGPNADGIISDDGAGGSLWTTVAGFIDYIRSTNGPGAINLLRNATGAVARSLADWFDDDLSVMDFISLTERVKIRLRTSTADMSAAFNAASVAAGAYGSIKVPRGLYYCESVVDILDGQTWKFDGPTITHTDDTATILRADSKTGFSILGRLFLRGTLVTAATTAEIGLLITNGKRYRVEGVTATNFKGAGIQLDGTTTGGTALRGDRGQLTDCSTHQCTVGLNIDDAAGAEYVTHTNFTASGNIDGIVLDAGNNTFMGGNVVDNTNGIQLTGVGANHGHGMFVGTNINHNTSSNIHAENVTRGFTFLGCHIYGNASTSQGNIWFENSKGIFVGHGVIDAWIYNDTGASSGINRVVGNYLPTNYVGSPLANTALQSNNSGLGELEVLDNWTYSGPAALNDPAPVYVRATRGASTQALTSGVATVVIWNSESLDKRSAYDTTTGVFTAPVTGTYRFSVALRVTGTTLSAPWGQFRVNGTVVRDCTGSLPSTTLAIIGGSVELPLTAGDTFDFVANVTGTSPVVAITVSALTIELMR